LKQTPAPDGPSPQQPIRKSVAILLIVLLLGLVAGVLAYVVHHREHSRATTSNPEASASLSTPDTNPGPAALAPESADPAPVANAPVPPVKPLVQNTAVPAAVPEAPPRTRQLISALVQLNMPNGPLTPEKLSSWEQNLQQLTNSGTAGIAAIREFLQTKANANFDSSGASLLGEPSLRLALLDALAKIGGPEATALAADTLHSTTDPQEIAALARMLEVQAPGQYRQAALDSARAALAEASAGKLGNTDVGALFTVLQQYGGAEALPDLQSATGRWGYYGAISLAGLPDGAGIPALTQMAQDSSAGARVRRSAALQALAQLAPDSADARAVLLDQTQNGQIPAATWIKISSLLGGEQLQIGLGGDPASVSPQTQPRSTYTLGNQNFSTVSILERLSPDQINQRIQLIDQLLAANANSPGLDSLKRARSTLAARVQ